MTQAELNRKLADVTGESVREIVAVVPRVGTIGPPPLGKAQSGGALLAAGNCRFP